jgi:Fe2+ or Zn2+ uptake regulation protein
MRSPEQLTELFRRSGRKVTPQRHRIFELLQGDGSHPSAENLYRRLSAEMSTVSRKTVYQTLWELAAMGEIQALDLGTGQMRFDPNVDGEHQHLVCERCEAVVDADIPVPDDLAPGRVVGNYLVHKTEVIVRGLCPKCLSELGDSAGEWLMARDGYTGLKEESWRN